MRGCVWGAVASETALLGEAQTLTVQLAQAVNTTSQDLFALAEDINITSLALLNASTQLPALEQRSVLAGQHAQALAQQLSEVQAQLGQANENATAQGATVIALAAVVNFTEGQLRDVQQQQSRVAASLGTNLL